MGSFLSTASSEDDQYYRQQANAHATKRNEFFEQSQSAYKRGDGEQAKELSIRGKEQQELMEKANKKAAEVAFLKNNKEREIWEIDLHGLYVKEAVYYAREAVAKCQKKKLNHIVFIVGMGNNSLDGVRKIKPAIEELMHGMGLKLEEDKPTKGCLYVDLNGPKKSLLSCVIF